MKTFLFLVLFSLFFSNSFGAMTSTISLTDIFGNNFFINAFTISSNLYYAQSIDSYNQPMGYLEKSSSTESVFTVCLWDQKNKRFIYSQTSVIEGGKISCKTWKSKTFAMAPWDQCGSNYNQVGNIHNNIFNQLYYVLELSPFSTFFSYPNGAQSAFQPIYYQSTSGCSYDNLAKTLPSYFIFNYDESSPLFWTNNATFVGLYNLLKYSSQSQLISAIGNVFNSSCPNSSSRITNKNPASTTGSVFPLGSVPSTYSNFLYQWTPISYCGNYYFDYGVFQYTYYYFGYSSTNYISHQFIFMDVYQGFNKFVNGIETCSFTGGLCPINNILGGQKASVSNSSQTAIDIWFTGTSNVIYSLPELCNKVNYYSAQPSFYYTQYYGCTLAGQDNFIVSTYTGQCCWNCTSSPSDSIYFYVNVPFQSFYYVERYLSS